MSRDYAAPDWRGLCEELASTLERAQKALRFEGGCSDATDSKRRALIDRARAALAQPEPEVAGPTDEELLELYPITMVDQEDAFAFARAVLARWGRPAPVPAEEDVAELVALIRQIALAWEPDACLLGNMTSGQLARAADLLERQAAPMPVAVSERLPGAEDCDAEGRCWVHQPHEACPESPAWELMLAKYASSNYGATYWLPATALPLPSGEVEHG